MSSTLGHRSNGPYGLRATDRHMDAPDCTTDFAAMYLTSRTAPTALSSSDESDADSISRASGAVTLYDPSAVERGLLENDFCREDNVQYCAAYLSQEMVALGLPSLFDTTSSSLVMPRVINNAYTLLQKLSVVRRQLDIQTDSRSRAEIEVKRLLQCQDRLKNNLESTDRLLAMSQLKVSELNKQKEQLGDRLRVEKEEVKRLISASEHRDAHVRHEMRKKEQETVRLKERLNQMLQNKLDKKQVSDIKILNPVSSSARQRPSWAVARGDEDTIYRQMIGAYEERQKVLLNENSDLRRGLHELQTELVAMLRQPNSTAAMDRSSNNHPTSVSDEAAMFENSVAARVTSTSTPTRRGSEIVPPRTDITASTSSRVSPVGNCTALSKGQLEMPFSFVKDDILKSLKANCGRVRQRINNNALPGGSGTTSQDDPSSVTEVSKLKQKVEQCESIISQQEQVIQDLMAQQSHVDDRSFLRDANLLDDVEQISRDKQFCIQQRQLFDRECSDMAAKLEEKSRAIDEARWTLLHEYFMKMTPFRKAHTSSTVPALPTVSEYDTKNTRSPAVTPQISLQARGASLATPRNVDRKLETPKTVDLYRVLGILSDRGTHASPSMQQISLQRWQAVVHDSPWLCGQNNVTTQSRCMEGISKQLFKPQSQRPF